jgi:hypothetical protein
MQTCATQPPGRRGILRPQPGGFEGIGNAGDYAETFSGAAAAGIRGGVWIRFGIAAGGGSGCCVGVSPQTRATQAARLERWLEGEEPALESPPLLAGIREALDSRRLSASRR